MVDTATSSCWGVPITVFDLARGIFCRLQRPNIEDHETLVRWLNDPYLATTVFDDANYVGTAEDQAKFWIEHNAEVYGASELTLIARSMKDNAPVGLLLLKNVDWRSRTADIHYLVGEAKFRNTAYGPELALLSMLWAFNTLNFHKIYGYVMSDNTASQNLASFGGTQESVVKNYIETDTGWLDYHLYSLSAADFRNFLEKNKNGVLRRHFQRQLILQ